MNRTRTGPPSSLVPQPIVWPLALQGGNEPTVKQRNSIDSDLERAQSEKEQAANLFQSDTESTMDVESDDCE